MTEKDLQDLAGPVYTETLNLLGATKIHFPAEPFNTVTNLIFLALVIYFGRRVFPQHRNHWFLTIAIPILFIGWLGGTMYHGTRGWSGWLTMDWMPIVILLTASAVRFILKSGIHWSVAIIIIAFPFLLIWGVRWMELPRWVARIGFYSFMVIVLILPLLLYLRKTAWKYWQQLAFAFGFFGLAIWCRSIDRTLGAELLPTIGTHWLWHTFGATASGFLMNYIYLDGEAIKFVKQKTNTAMA